MEFLAFGPYRGVTGYDSVMRNFIQGWSNNFHNFKLLEFGQWSNFRSQTSIDGLIETAEKVTLQNPEFMINFCLLDQTRLETSTKNVCYTMFEADGICQRWVEAAGGLDLIIVPSEFNRKSFIASGIPPSKLAVCPVPLNIEKIKAKPIVTKLSAGLEDLNRYKHRFLNCSEFVTRKNIDGLLRLWTDEMKPEDDACLVLKLNSNSGLKLDWFSDKIAKYTKNKNCAPVYIITDLMTEEAMLSLCHWCTHYVTMSFGEGWGMSESVCGVLGKTIIAPKHTAFTEYLDDSTAYLINSQQAPACTDGPVARYYAGLRWFAPIHFAAKKALRASLSEDGSKGKLLSERLCKMCDMNTVSERLVNIAKNHVSKRSTPLPVLGKGDYSLAMICKSAGQESHCGIADYSMNLYQHVCKVENTEHKLKGAVLVNGESVYYSQVFDKHKVSLLHLQLEYQFISPKRLGMLIDFCNNSEMRALITLHTVNPKAWDYHEVLQNKQAHVCVSSQLMKDTLLLKCGFTDASKVHVVPMGIKKEEVISPDLTLVKNARPLVGFFGFCYFHKGIDRIVRLAKDHPEIDFVIYSTKPANDSGYWDKCRSLLSKVPNVQWNEEYLEEGVLIKSLSLCDAIFLPYMEYGGIGVSAAIRTCLKAGVPILALENSFFKDIVFDSGLVKFVGVDPSDYTNWSVNFIEELTKIRDNPQISINYLQLRDKFVESYNWDKVAQVQAAVYNEVIRV
jgi:glycosyltransferase involved in cell wall biosynthesis